MSRRISLREFQSGLAKRLAEAGTSDRRSLLGVHAGSRSWLVDLPEAGEILPVPPLAPVPLARRWLRGLANIRGTLFGVVDFAAFIGEPTTPPGGNARLLLIGARQGINTALLVTAAAGLRNPDDFEPAGVLDETAPPWAQMSYKDLHERTWTRLDVPALLADPRFLEAGIDH